jgi:hypothetical protein
VSKEKTNLKSKYNVSKKGLAQLENAVEDQHSALKVLSEMLQKKNSEECQSHGTAV